MKTKKIMNLTQLCAFNSLILAKKAKHDEHCNPRIRSFFVDKEENNLRNGKLKHIVEPFYRLKILQSQSPYIIPKLYNALPYYLRLPTTTIKTFKSELRKILFN